MNTPMPPKLLRRAAALVMLKPYGVGEAEFDKAIAAGVIERIVFRDGGRAYYATAQLRRVFIAPLDRFEPLSPATTTNHHTPHHA